MAFLVVSLTRYDHPQWGTKGLSFTQELGPNLGFPLSLEADSWYRSEDAMGYYSSFGFWGEPVPGGEEVRGKIHLLFPKQVL